MTSSFLFRGVLGFSVVGAASVGTLYFGTDLFNREAGKKEAISSLVKTVNPEKRLISAKGGDDSHWQASWKLYRERNQNSEKDIWSVEGWKRFSGVVQTENAPEGFIKICLSKSSIRVLNEKDETYKQVLDYCSRDTLVSDLVAETEGKISLVGSSVKEDWDRAWGVYVSQNPNKQQSQDSWGLSNWNTEHGNSDAPQSFKDACSSKAGTKTGSMEHLDYKNFLLWCTK